MPNTGRRWTPEHDEYLRRYLPLVGYRTVAQNLGRSVAACYERASARGIGVADTGRPPRWTTDEDEQLRAWLQRAAQALGKTERATAARVHRLATKQEDRAA